MEICAKNSAIQKTLNSELGNLSLENQKSKNTQIRT